MKVSLVKYTTDPLSAIELAASNCYDSVPNGKIMNACYKSGHHSVLEFAQFHFHIEGISRACSHQLVRTRTASFAQRSQRFVSEDGFDYVTPPALLSDDDHTKAARELYDDTIKRIRECYEVMQTLGVKNEDARFILPNACCTTIDMSIDFRNLCHFMNERLCSKAQWEIRELAQKMRRLVVEVFPEADNMLVPKCERFEMPFCTENKSCGRHEGLKELITGCPF